MTHSTGLLPAAGALRMTPARWLTLAIGVPVIVALIGWTGFSVVTQLAHASFPVSYPSIPVTDGQLTLSLDSGNITVRQDQGQTSTARLSGTVQYTLARPSVTERSTATGTRLDVNCRVPGGSCGLNATLAVPPQTGLTLASGGGDLSVSGAISTVSLSSGGGDVALSGVTGIATVDTGGGDLTASDLGAIGKFTTAGGDIDGNDLTAPTVNADSGGGDVALVFTQVPANLDITSDGGDVTLLLPHGSTAYDLTSNADGGDASVSVPVSQSSSHRINVESGGGDISVAEAS